MEGGGDPYAQQLRVNEHPLVWCFEDVVEGKPSDVSGRAAHLAGRAEPSVAMGQLLHQQTHAIGCCSPPERVALAFSVDGCMHCKVEQGMQAGFAVRASSPAEAERCQLDRQSIRHSHNCPLTHYWLAARSFPRARMRTR